MSKIVSPLALVLLLPLVALAAEPKRELLWPTGAPGAKGDAENDKPVVTVYLADGPNKTDCGVVVLPGGGYGHLALGHEGVDIANWYNSFGVSAFVVEYRHSGKGYAHPAPMQDAQRAIRMVRANAKEFGVSPNKIGVMGFSAGGHLASTVATHFDAGDASAEDPIQRVSSRPDFAILCYPVIAFDQPFTHRGSQKNLIGENADPELVKSLSNELQVTSDTPPTFLFHTSEDTGVPPQNSIVFYEALQKAKVPAEMHIFAKGRHGVGLAANIPGTNAWPKLCEAWMTGLGMLPAQADAGK
ncbi:alpha/beta hydrolase [Blastopirellula sp. JC732]|uniref:Alpha/beta hydrolase n=1 Tax=Blastopirellula sediminis TaxID=2894196 RepID=A0A9X1MIB6_9BACT|nr:alpha/beta hydrolase [Blastopirellula sediminis]MCC9607778.1 alpha/beta hydrolase [Blastopirellula sediminis]MCC9627429.1 alpha/beta hydrolase [Blastopirellula sediminis]